MQFGGTPSRQHILSGVGARTTRGNHWIQRHVHLQGPEIGRHLDPNSKFTSLLQKLNNWPPCDLNRLWFEVTFYLVRVINLQHNIRPPAA